MELPFRLYLTGDLLIETEAGSIDQRRLPARQGRRAFAYLACERWRGVPRDELADAIWGETAPGSWDSAIHAIVSKLRRVLRGLGADIVMVSSTYHLELPDSAWVDIEVAASAIDEADSISRGADPKRAWGPANVAAVIASRPFLPGEEGDWIERQRSRLRSFNLRALDCLAQLSLANGESSLAAQFASEALNLEPCRETAGRWLMRAYTLSGSRAEALKAYDALRQRLAEELGADPSPETTSLYLQLLRGE